MRKHLAPWIAAAALLPPVGPLALATAADVPAGRRGEAKAVIVEAGPPIDGTLRSPIWSKCPPLPLGECERDRPGPMKTTARALLDAKRLYVAWQCAEADTASLLRRVRRRDGEVWTDDCVELFVTGDPRVGWFHFAVNPAGVLLDAVTRGSKRDDRSFDSSAEVKATIEEGKGWTVTLAVPLKEIGAFAGEGQTWMLNLNRTRPARGERPMVEWSWAVMGSSDYHRRADYGRLTGVDVPRRPDGVARTATPPPVPPKHNQGEAAGSVTVYRRLGDVRIEEGGEGLARTYGLKIRGSAGLKVAFLASCEGGVEQVPFNMYDRRAGDNTTSKAYRLLTGGRWRAMVYFCDRFRYNAQPDGTVARATDYSNLRFHGRTAGGKGVLHLRDLTIYRGEDTTAPPAPARPAARSDERGVHLSWPRGKDNVGLAFYLVGRAGADGRFVKIAEAPLPLHTDRPPAAGPWRYRVAAVDFQDNVSPWSPAAPAWAARAFEQPAPTKRQTDRLAYADRIRQVHAAGAGKVNRGRVLCFGDSLTGATSYPRTIEAALGRYVVVGRGYPSMKTSFGRGRIERELAEVNPEFCLILYGTNNSKSAKAIGPATDDLAAMAAACEKRGTVAIVGTIPPRGFKDPNSQPEARFNAAVIEMCRRRKIPVAYNFAEFQASGDRRQLIARDGVHTFNKGFVAFARSWRKTMDEVTFALRDGPTAPAAPAAAAAATAAAPGAAAGPSRPAAPPAEPGSTDPTEQPRPSWPPKGRPVRLNVTRDTWTGTVKDEKYGNNGSSDRLKLKGQQEHVIFDADCSALKGRRITGALWHVRTASPKAPLGRVTVSSLATPWVEGTSSGYRRQDGSACFVQAELGRRDWAYPGSTLMDAAFGRGHTIWRFAEASPPDANGWQAVAVGADVVAARVAGLSEGFAAYDDVGSIWSYKGGKFTYTYFPNRYVYSRQRRGSEPWLEVWTDGTDEEPPGPVTDVKADTTEMPAGEAMVTWKTPPDVGGTKTLGFHVTCTAPGKAAKSMPRYLIPMAGHPGRTVRMHVQDLPLKPGETVTLSIAAVDAAGNVGPAVTKALRVSSRPGAFRIADVGLEPFPASPRRPAVGGLKVAVVDLVDKVHSTTGAMIPPRPVGYKGGNHLWSAREKLIRLHAARNEAVCFQLNLEGRAEKVNVDLGFPEASGLRARVYRLDCVKTSAGVVPDVAVPLAAAFAVPPADDPEAADASNLSLLCEVYVPHKTPAGRQAGRLRVHSGAQTLEMAVELTVRDFSLPNKLSFVPEMNAYGTVNPTGNLAYYRVAHEHRLCVNRLYYPWSGRPTMAPKWTADGGFDFSQWDKWFGPLLDGSAFADLPRSSEPVDVFYLHFNENWPADVYAAYLKTYWADRAFRPEYKQTLKKAFAAFAAHCDAKKWHETIFQYYLNNKVYYKRGGWRRSAAPWIFDEPVNTQDFWALRWYGLIWQQAVGPVRGQAKMWYRGDVSRSEYGRDMFRGVMDLECLGGTNEQKVRIKHDEQRLWGRGYFTEYGSANDPAGANAQPVVWCLKAWSHGAVGLLPWQTIGGKENFAQGSKTGLLLPHGRGVAASIRVKAFRRGQQDTEYLTLLADVYKQPLWAVASGLTQRIDLGGKVLKTSESDAGTIRFDKADASALWRLRMAVGQMLSSRRPPYRRCIRPMPSPPRDLSRLPPIGYVRVAPPLPPGAPEMD